MRNCIIFVLLCMAWAIEDQQQQSQFPSNQSGQFPLIPQQEHQSPSRQGQQREQTDRYYPLLERQQESQQQPQQLPSSTKAPNHYVTRRPEYQVNLTKTSDTKQRQYDTQYPEHSQQYSCILGQPTPLYLQNVQEPQQPAQTQTTTTQIIITEVKQLLPQSPAATVISTPSNLITDKITQLHQYVKEVMQQYIAEQQSDHLYEQFLLQNKSQIEDDNKMPQKSGRVAPIPTSTTFTPLNQDDLEHVSQQYSGINEQYARHQPHMIEEQYTKRNRNRRAVTVQHQQSPTPTTPTQSRIAHSLRHETIENPKGNATVQSPSSTLIPNNNVQSSTSSRRHERAVTTTFPTTTITSSSGPLGQEITKGARSHQTVARTQDSQRRSQRRNLNTTTQKPSQQITNLPVSTSATSSATSP